MLEDEGDTEEGICLDSVYNGGSHKPQLQNHSVPCIRVQIWGGVLDFVLCCCR
jgi:hypothetical protein